VNLGSDVETTVLELAGRILDLTGSASAIRLVPYGEVYGQPFQDVRRRIPDLRKMRALVGDLPETDLDTLLRRILEWRASNRPALGDAEPAPAGPGGAGQS
jgi:UDP-glucose 4-epimerase